MGSTMELASLVSLLSGDNTEHILTSLFAIVPGSLAAYYSYRNHLSVKTNHGQTIGQHVEALRSEVADTAVQVDAANIQTAAKLATVVEETAAALETQRHRRDDSQPLTGTKP